MARTAVSKKITNSVSYTVPSGKMFVFSARITEFTGGGGGIGEAPLLIDGERVGSLYLPSSSGITIPELKPLVANGGEVVSTTGANFSISLNGILYD